VDALFAFSYAKIQGTQDSGIIAAILSFCSKLVIVHGQHTDTRVTFGSTRCQETAAGHLVKMHELLGQSPSSPMWASRRSRNKAEPGQRSKEGHPMWMN